MADAPQIHPLRHRMVEDMTLRGINSASQKTYLRAVRACCAHVGCTPAELTAEDARAFAMRASACFQELLRHINSRPSSQY